MSPLRSGRGRKPQPKASQGANSPSDAITLLHSSPSAPEEVVVEKETLPTRGRGRKRQQEPSPTTATPGTPKKVTENVPAKRGRGRPKANEKPNVVEEPLRSQASIQSDVVEIDHTKVFAVKSGRGRKPLNKEVEVDQKASASKGRRGNQKYPVSADIEEEMENGVAGSGKQKGSLENGQDEVIYECDSGNMVAETSMLLNPMQVLT